MSRRTRPAQNFADVVAEARRDALRSTRFQHLPADYESWVAAWYSRPWWTDLETANLLGGFAPGRPATVDGEDGHSSVVADRLKLIRKSLGTSLRPIEVASFFNEIQMRVDPSAVVGWAHDQGIEVPPEMRRADRRTFPPPSAFGGHSTPALEVLLYAVDEFYVKKTHGDDLKQWYVARSLHEKFGAADDTNPRGLSYDMCKKIDQIIAPESPRRRRRPRVATKRKPKAPRNKPSNDERKQL
jgi:hypothetical protein